MNKVIVFWQIFKNMGLRYVLFRVYYELKRKTGALKKDFPTSIELRSKFSLTHWKSQKPSFLISSKEELSFKKSKNPILKKLGDHILKGEIRFFNHTFVKLGLDYDWLTHPTTGMKYPLLHWTEIPDFSEEYGDIKEVWEKSRFSYLISIVRYDYHFDKDLADFAFDEILNWIHANPLNLGPNYRCSQEISIRVLNWLYVLYYYQNSPLLTSTTFETIIQSIYGQMCHVYNNINFSRIAVRNNHAITETLTLYIVGMLLPELPESGKWKDKGKSWFEEEVAYQVYKDGTFLQFSMTYHRVVVQLFNYAFAIAHKNNEKFGDAVYHRAHKSLEFLSACMSFKNGNLPNYGANDGALFFPFTDADYRDFRPQLNTLSASLGRAPLSQEAFITEELLWHSIKASGNNLALPSLGVHKFEIGGYYIIRESNSLTFIRCGNHRDRPSHADNLHVDIWIDGENVVRDAGSYKYNTDKELVDYFSGTSSHNTIVVNDESQMKKGIRFIWMHWTQRIFAELKETQSGYIFEGSISCYRFLNKSFFHRRKLIKPKNKQIWKIDDKVSTLPELKIKQVWNIHELAPYTSIQKAVDGNGDDLEPSKYPAMYSSYYGNKEDSSQIVFESKEPTIKTSLEWIKGA